MKTVFFPLIEDLPLSYRWRPALAQPAGLVILMHGVGSNEAALLGLASHLSEDHAVALVRSPLTMAPGAYSAFAVSFTADGPKIDGVAAENSRQKLHNFVLALQARYEIPATRTVIGGFSQGGIMSASLALTAPGCIRGFAILSGRILPEIGPLIASAEELRGISAFVAHGDTDDRLPISWAERSVSLLEERGVPCQFRRYPMGHEVNRGVAADFAHWVHQLLAP